MKIETFWHNKDEFIPNSPMHINPAHIIMIRHSPTLKRWFIKLTEQKTRFYINNEDLHQVVESIGGNL